MQFDSDDIGRGIVLLGTNNDKEYKNLTAH